MGVIIVFDNKGIFDIYRLNSNFTSSGDKQIEPDISYGTIKSTLYQHYKRSKYDYDIQILFPSDSYHHGAILFGGSISKFVDYMMIKI